MMRHLALVLLLATTLLRAADPELTEDWTTWADYQKQRFEYATWWKPQVPGPNTVALLHFDADFTDAGPYGAQVLDAAALTRGPGRFGEGLVLAGTPLRLRTGKPLFTATSGILQVEFWLRLDAMPEAPVSLVDYPHKHRERNGLHFILHPDGHLLFETLGAAMPRWPEPGEDTREHRWHQYKGCSTPPGVVTAGTWHHLAFHTGASHETWENRMTVWVDGREVGTTPRGWRLVPEEGATELSFGGGVQGSLDELRILSGICRRYYPIPDDSWTDPAAKRTVDTRPQYVAPAGDRLFYASFDESATPEVAAAAKPHRTGAGLLRPGVRGSALAIASRENWTWPAPGNIDLHRGSIEMWIKPLDWSGEERPQTGFFRINGEDKTALYWYIANTGFHANTVIWGGAGRQGSGAGTSFVAYPPDTWTHLMLTWDRDDTRLYVDGEEKIAHFYDQPFATYMPSPTEFALPSGGPMLVDEFTIWNRALGATEVANHYRRYLPKPELTPLPGDPAFGSLLVTAFPGVGRLRLLPTFRDPAGIARLNLRLEQDGRVVARQDAADPAGDLLLDGVPVRLPAGRYRAVVDALDAGGKVLGTVAAWYDRPDFPWLGNTLGITDRVLKPYTPIEFAGNVVKTVGRAYHLAPTGLPARIETFGDDILAGPIHLEIEHDGSWPKLKPAPLRLIDAKPDRAAWTSTTSPGDLAVTVSAELDYDGMAKYTITRTAAKPVEVKAMRLVVPLKAEYAQLYFWAGHRASHRFNVIPAAGVLPPEDGVVFDSRRCYDDWKPTVGSFIPELWIGNDERGICFLADSDRGWVPSDDVASIEVVRRGEVAELRLNLVAVPATLRDTATIVFGLQATPVRPLPPNWRAYAMSFGLPKGMAEPVDFTPPPWGTFDVGVVDPGGIDGRPYDPEGVRHSIAAQREKNCTPVVHLDTSMYNWGQLAPDCPYPYFQEEWSSCGVGFNWIFTRSKIDWGVASHKRWQDEFGLQGVYFDTGSLRHNYNLYSGTAYRLPDGRVQPGWTVWGQREYFRRSAHLFGDFGTENFTRGCGFYGPPFAAWQLGCNVGEQRQRKPEEIYYEQVSFPWPVHRVIAVSNKWGHIQQWLPPNDGYERTDEQRKYIRSFYAQHMQLDTRTVFTSFRLPAAVGLFGVYRPETVFHGFWKNADTLRLADDDGKPLDRDVFIASYYQQGEKRLLYLSNLGLESRWVTVSLRVPGAAWAAADAEALEEEWAYCGQYHEYYSWNRGGLAMVGYNRDGTRISPEETAANRALHLTQPADGWVTLRLYVPFKDYRAVYLNPVE